MIQIDRSYFAKVRRMIDDFIGVNFDRANAEEL